jgi:ring-1,2-phenylacetyl-CoA epoxidase subunit PaaE
MGVSTSRLPRSWASAIEQLRRDARAVGLRVAGRGPSPLVKGTPGPAQAEAEARAFASAPARGARGNARELVVARVVRETADASTLVLRDPGGAPFAFAPGQFFTLLCEVDGETVTRNYSASNAPGTGELHLTIKRKLGGAVSPVLCRAQAGDRLRALGPFGAFVVPPALPEGAPRRLVLVAGGAGITPLASIARTLLATEPAAELALVYANRREEDIILASELRELALAHARRLTIVHVLEEPPAGFEGVVGRLDRVATARALATLPLASHAEARFYVCGPEGMRDEVLAALAARGVADSAIFIERFVIGPRPHAAISSATVLASAAPGARPVAIRVKGRTHRTVALPGATLLEAGLAAGAPMPFSCAVGGCGACRVRLVSGTVELEEPNCLGEAERAAGYVLACVGRPSGPCVVEVPEGA